MRKKILYIEDDPDIPIIMISAVREIDNIAESCGANAYIRKPFEMYDVIDVVNNHYPIQ